jgi:hypothetical protein
MEFAKGMQVTERNTREPLIRLQVSRAFTATIADRTQTGRN